MPRKKKTKEKLVLKDTNNGWKPLSEILGKPPEPTLKEALELGQKYGVKRIKTDSLEIEFNDKITIERKDLNPLVGKTVGLPTEDDFLFAATEGFKEEDSADKNQ